MITLHGQPIAREAFLWNGEVVLEPAKAANRRNRWRRSALALAAMVAGTSLVLAKEASAGVPSGPVLWTGLVESASGEPAPGVQVVAFARPPVDRLLAGEEVVPIAEVATNDTGRFTLRAAPNSELAGMADESGWLTVMVAGFAPDGMSLATDSVTWQTKGGEAGVHAFAAGDSDSGQWVSEPGAMASTSSGPTRTVPEAPAPTERPRLLSLRPHDVAPSAGRVQAFGTQPSPWCGPVRSKPAGKDMVSVGELHLNQRWGGYFSYTNTKSSSFEIGVSQDGKHWSGAGSTSLTRERSTSQDGPVPSADTNRLFTYKAEMLFRRFEWVCYPGMARQYTAYTLEPVDWTGGMREEPGGKPPGCDKEYLTDVMPGKNFTRSEHASTTLRGALSIAGFSGTVSTAVSDAVVHKYVNTVPAHRYVCGESGRLTGDTRVSSLR